MTVSYPTSNFIFFLLFRWRGSVWKTVWKRLLIWLIFWYVIHFAIHYALPKEKEKSAIEVVATFNTFCNSLPLVFILGFYVGQVISTRVYKRFPDLEHLVDAGLMTKQELALIKGSKCENTRWQMPLEWIIGKVIFPSDLAPPTKNAFCGSVNAFRNGLRQLFTYDWIAIPLVYTQTVAIVVYGYFAFALIGHQYLGKSVDLRVPWLSILQFFFFVGWLNVARDLMYPFGEDEDDIELNCILDRHAAAAFSLATDVRENMPDFVTDDNMRQKMGQKMLSNLTYSIAATKIADRPPKLRTSKIKLREADHAQQEKHYEAHATCQRNFF